MSKLLIVIDMQKGFRFEESLAIAEKFNKHISNFDNVCFAMFENRKKSLFETQLKWVDFQNDEDKELLDGLDVPENAHFINHHNYTVYNDELKSLIKKLAPSEIYLSGLFSDVCLLKTSMDMFDDEIIPYIIKDLSASPHGDNAHDVAFATMAEAIGDDRIITINDVV